MRCKNEISSSESHTYDDVNGANIRLKWHGRGPEGSLRGPGYP